ncbi:hypothetical protein HEB29_005746 [Streptomyces fulvorobeus]|uniref:Uncharacterized protein n=1 Tax=Streptomyces fulvorobeus TaxID=284028 RepID=A0A7Y9HHL7_9ACTN|nr:hypothetical protein [Streptomyces fulvorobeus]
MRVTGQNTDNPTVRPLEPTCGPDGYRGSVCPPGQRRARRTPVFPSAAPDEGRWGWEPRVGRLGRARPDVLYAAVRHVGKTGPRPLCARPAPAPGRQRDRRFDRAMTSLPNSVEAAPRSRPPTGRTCGVRPVTRACPPPPRRTPTVGHRSGPPSRPVATASGCTERGETPVAATPPRRSSNPRNIGRGAAACTVRKQTNREIADRLSQDGCVMHPLSGVARRKLGVTGRQELCVQLRDMRDRPSDAS